jgi:hypothetical protein
MPIFEKAEAGEGATGTNLEFFKVCILFKILAAD